MNSGIYQIRNKINNKIYIGSSINLNRRESEHLSKLSLNKHPSYHLQSSYNKYGKENFVFEILIICLPDTLLFYEQQFIDQLSPEYNKRYIAENNYGLKMSESAKLRMSISKKNHVVSVDTRQKIRLANKGIPNNNLAKTYIGFVSPSNEIYRNVFNLHEFCRKHQLKQSNLHNVASGKRKSYKGWKALIEE